jgi:hypothetical protein
MNIHKYEITLLLKKHAHNVTTTWNVNIYLSIIITLGVKKAIINHLAQLEG